MTGMTMSKDQREDMTASEMAMRKFLKQLGVTAHQELADALAKAVADGKIAAGAEVAVTARVEIAICNSHMTSRQIWWHLNK
jgi:hypothetical protein